MNFEFAAIAGSGIDLADRQATAEPLSGCAIDPAGELGNGRVVLAGAASVRGRLTMLSKRSLRMTT